MSYAWIYDRGRRERKEELGKQRNRQEQLIGKSKKSITDPEIIPLNNKNDLTPTGAPISDDDSSDDDSFVEYPHAESEGYFYDDVA